MLLEDARHLQGYAQKLSIAQLAKVMHISPALAARTKTLIDSWEAQTASPMPALDVFVGDIYSGLQAATFNNEDREYAQQHLRILSGLYGILRPLDGIAAYRLEMGYKIPGMPVRNLYEFWGSKIADTLPKDKFVINASSVEYSQTITKYISSDRVFTPQFLTVDPKNGDPAFVVVHAKIARGAFARWVLQHRIEDAEKFSEFTDLGYEYQARLSTMREPVFVCKEFGGKGLSMRLNA